MKKCKHCGEAFKPYTTLQKYCSAKCMKADNGFKAIKKVSAKRQTQNEIYSQLRKVFLSKPENKVCFIDGCKKPSDTIEHRAGRWGKNFLDTTTWAGCCSKHNIELENNPELAKKYQLSKITGKPKLK